jgi:phage/plasmid-associated DNA primase
MMRAARAITGAVEMSCEMTEAVELQARAQMKVGRLQTLDESDQTLDKSDQTLDESDQTLDEGGRTDKDGHTKDYDDKVKEYINQATDCKKSNEQKVWIDKRNYSEQSFCSLRRKVCRN